MTKILTIGEPLMRLSSPKGQRLEDTKIFDFVVGGAEYNVACNLAQFGNDVSFASKVPNNSFGKNIIRNLKSFSVDTSQLLESNGSRLGIYYLEFGDGYRSSRVIYDRKYSAFAEMKYCEWDYDLLFKDITHLHLTGITLAISNFWEQIGFNIIEQAKRRGIFISFDMNYRQSMWSVDVAKQNFNKIVPLVDALSASHLDAKVFFDIKLDSNTVNSDYVEEIAHKFQNLVYIYGTDRINMTSNSYKIQGYLYNNKKRKLYCSRGYEILSVIDRVGTGDSYASGILDGIINGLSDDLIVEFAMASSVMKHSVFGDINKFTRKEIFNFLSSDQNIIR